jgi:hypothetical protein
MLFVRFYHIDSVEILRVVIFNHFNKFDYGYNLLYDDMLEMKIYQKYVYHVYCNLITVYVERLKKSQESQKKNMEMMITPVIVIVEK